MIQALDRNSDYLMNAQLFPYTTELQPNGAPSASAGIFFKCRLADVVANDNQYPVKNLSAYGAEMAVETLYNFHLGENDYTPKRDDYVYVNEGWWTVKKTTIVEVNKKEKTLGLNRLKFGNIKTTIYLVKETVG